MKIQTCFAARSVNLPRTSRGHSRTPFRVGVAANVKLPRASRGHLSSFDTVSAVGGAFRFSLQRNAESNALANPTHGRDCVKRYWCSLKIPPTQLVDCSYFAYILVAQDGPEIPPTAVGGLFIPSLLGLGKCRFQNSRPQSAGFPFAASEMYGYERSTDCGRWDSHSLWRKCVGRLGMNNPPTAVRGILTNSFLSSW